MLLVSEQFLSHCGVLVAGAVNQLINRFLRHFELVENQ